MHGIVQPRSNLYLTAARFYAGLGFAVLSIHSVRDGRCSCGKANCKSAGKHPIASLVPRGVKDATKNPALVMKWWTEYPDANVGVATGRISNIVVVDIDGEKGRETLRKLTGSELPTPKWTATTGRAGGGAHLYYAYPEKGTVPTHKYNGLEVRSDGAYVVAPPSIHASGKRYDWLSFHKELPTTLPKEPLPEVLLDFAVNRLKPDDGDGPTDAGTDLSDRIPPRHAKNEEMRVREALSHIPPDDRDIWLKAGMALQWTRWPDARSIWDDWSKHSDKHDKTEQDKAWESFRESREGPLVTLGTVYKLAQEYGWKPFADEIEELNAKYFVIKNYGGRCVIGWFEQNAAGSGIDLSVRPETY